MTQAYDSVQHLIMSFLQDHLNVDVLSPKHDLIETDVLDSLMIVDLVLYFEQTFNVVLSLEDLEIENFATVASMTAFVTARMDQPRRLSVA